MPKHKLPDELKVLHGTDQPVRMTKATSVPGECVALKAPEWMSLEQKRMFRGCAKILSNWKLLTAADEGIIASYVSSVSRFVDAEKHLAIEGVIINVKDEDGDYVEQRQNMWYQVSMAERKIMLQIEQQLGFSPISRAKILSLINSNKEEQKDEFSDFDR